MIIKTLIDAKYHDPEIHILSDSKSEAVETLAERIAVAVNDDIAAIAPNGDKCMISGFDIVRFYADGAKVMADANGQKYSIARKLYELEADLDSKLFFRISKSEIINLKRIKRLDMSITGTIKVIMKDGSESYTSRRNVAKLKQVLGL